MPTTDPTREYVECPGCGAMIAVAHAKNCAICYLKEILAGGDGGGESEE
jgi:hypothetical protein